MVYENLGAKERTASVASRLSNVSRGSGNSTGLGGITIPVGYTTANKRRKIVPAQQQLVLPGNDNYGVGEALASGARVYPNAYPPTLNDKKPRLNVASKYESMRAQ